MKLISAIHIALEQSKSFNFSFLAKVFLIQNQRNSFFRDWSLKWTYSSWAQVGGDCGLPTYALCGTPPSLKSLNTCIWSRAGTPRQVSSASSSSSCSCARASQIITDCLSGFWQTELLRSHNLCLVCLSMMLPVQIHTLPSRQNRHHRQILVLVWCPSLVSFSGLALILFKSTSSHDLSMRSGSIFLLDVLTEFFVFNADELCLGGVSILSLPL